MVTVDIAEFVRARLDEDEPGPGDKRDFTSLYHLAAAWSDHPDYDPKWALY